MSGPLIVVDFDEPSKPRKHDAGHNRHASEQTVGTPRDLLDAIERRWGKIGVDLAATAENAVAADYITREDDSLSLPWAELLDGRLGWLNCEFNDAGTWAEKCAHEMLLGARILLLTPSASGTNWFQDWVVPYAHVVDLGPRVKFVGHAQPFPKDLSVSVYWGGVTGRSFWRWREDQRRKATPRGRP